MTKAQMVAALIDREKEQRKWKETVKALWGSDSVEYQRAIARWADMWEILNELEITPDME